jgi:hypothetical protein
LAKRRILIMAVVAHRARGRIRDDRAVDNDTAVAREPVVRQYHPAIVLDRIIWFVAGLLITLLAFRFIFALLGANPANSFAHFVYSVSHPFVALFFSLFSYNYQYGVSRFETYTIVAILVYAVVAYFLSWLVNIPARRVE